MTLKAELQSLLMLSVLNENAFVNIEIKKTKQGNLLDGNHLNSHELMCVSLQRGKASFADQKVT